MPGSGAGFAELLRGLLDERGLSLRALARMVPVDAGQLSRVLSGKRRASLELARRCDEVLGTQGRLFRAVLDDRHRRAAGSADGALPSASSVRAQDWAGPVGWVRTVEMTPDVVGCYESLLAAQVGADNMLGPHPVLDGVERQAASLRLAVRAARGARRAPVARLASRYEEFLGWLHQDTGRLGAAMTHTDRARDLSVDLDDPDLAAYLLMRKSSIATDSGDPALALVLADAALSQTTDLPASIRAVVLRQKAHALAGLGDEPGCLDVIGEAIELVTAADPAPQSLAAYCTSDYIAMEAATCWLRLGRPDAALLAFNAAPGQWAAHLRRDYGLHLARRANAHAGVADVGAACDLAGQAIHLARQTASARTVGELAGLARQLTAWPARRDATAVRSAVASLVGSAG